MVYARSLTLPGPTVLGKRKPPTFSPRYAVSTAKFVDSTSPVSSEDEEEEPSADSDISPSDEDEDGDEEEDDDDEESLPLTSRFHGALELQASGASKGKNNSSTSDLMLVNGKLVRKTKKKYNCTWDGCEKSYTKPARLEEHERSHTLEVGAFVSRLAATIMVRI